MPEIPFRGGESERAREKEREEMVAVLFGHRNYRCVELTLHCNYNMAGCLPASHTHGAALLLLSSRWFIVCVLRGLPQWYFFSTIDPSLNEPSLLVFRPEPHWRRQIKNCQYDFFSFVAVAVVPSAAQLIFFRAVEQFIQNYPLDFQLNRKPFRHRGPAYLPFPFAICLCNGITSRLNDSDATITCQKFFFFFRFRFGFGRCQYEVFPVSMCAANSAIRDLTHESHQ